MHETVKQAVGILTLAAVGLAAEPSTVARTIACHSQDVIPLAVQVNFSTLLQFAPNQEAVAAVCGDKERWVVDHSKNTIFVTPQAKGTRTDLHVVMQDGDICTFSLREISDDKTMPADLRVYVKTPHDEGAPSNSRPVFYGADQVDSLRSQLAEAQRALDTQKASETQHIAKVEDAARVKAVANTRFDYTWDRDSKAAKVFKFKAMWHDAEGTYIEAHPEEVPALYETRDGKPSLVQYVVRNGHYEIPKILGDGYLAVGKTKLTFHRES